MTTDRCSACFNYFRTTSCGVLRNHCDDRGNLCSGSGLGPWEPLKTVWIRGGAA